MKMDSKRNAMSLFDPILQVLCTESRERGQNMNIYMYICGFVQNESSQLLRSIVFMLK